MVSTGASYPLTSADVGFTIRVYMDVNDGTTDQYSDSDATDVVVDAPPSASSAPRVSGSTSVGSTLTIDSSGTLERLAELRLPVASLCE